VALVRGALALTLAVSGCAYKVHVESDPPGATLVLPPSAKVTLPRRIGADRSVALPATVRLRWFPFQRHVALVSAPGYRPLEVSLGRHWARAVDWSDPVFWPRQSARIRADVVVSVRLVPEHGQAGTWTADSVP